MLTIQNFLDAFTYPFKDPDGIKKVLVGSILTSISGGIEIFAYTFLLDGLHVMSLLTWILSLVVILHVDGFIYWLYQDLIKNPDEHELPVWDDWREMFYTGSRIRLLELLFALPIIACTIYISLGPLKDMLNTYILIQSNHYPQSWIGPTW